MDQPMSKRKIFFLASIFILCILAGIGLMIPVNYYVMEPGSAVDVSSYVEVDLPQNSENGRFYLTTISLKEASVIDYLTDQLSDKKELIPVGQVRTPDMSEKDYDREQQKNMEESQNLAIIAAYTYAKKQIKVENNGVEVLRLLEGVQNDLQPGDVLQEVEGKKITNMESLQSILQEKKVGDQVTVKLIRNKKTLNLKVPVIELPSSPNAPKRHGFGFVPFVQTKVITNPKVNIQTENISGPSAGLMFTLEIIDQLLPENLTNGYQVAGTGTIDEKGNVGQIGGIKYKVMAADKQGAHIFFAPKDLYQGDNNERIAKETARQLKTEMKIVPVANVQEAIDYLRKQPYYPAAS